MALRSWISLPFPQGAAGRIAALAAILCVFQPWLLRGEVRLGNEVLAADGFRALQGKRLGLITNPSGVNRRGQTTIALLREAPGVRLEALFGPEHGLSGGVRAGDHVAGGKDPRTGLPVYSLYGATRKPTPAMLKGLDVLVYDLQDTGVRSYTFVSTMGLAMEACAEAGIEFVVLDRPDPLGGERVEGPLVHERFRSFISQWDVPYVYGMTCGELARMINGERWIKKPCRLTVVPMTGWRRSMVWNDTGLRWIPTSPNVPRAESAFGYAALGLFGEVATGSGVSIGGVFQRPFECVTARWLDAGKLSRQMERYGLAGVSFPVFSLPQGATVHRGIELRFSEAARAPLVAINYYLLDAIRQTSGRDLLREASRAGRDFNLFDKANGSDALRKALSAGTPVADLVASWKTGEEAFRKRRQPYLLYFDGVSSPEAAAPTPTRIVPWRSPAAPAAAAPTNFVVITISRGDTLQQIARDFRTSISAIAEANPGVDIQKLKAGQTLRIPRS